MHDVSVEWFRQLLIKFFGFELTPRLATHPDILKENKMNLSKRIQKKLKDSMNSDGFPKINKGYYENYHS